MSDTPAATNPPDPPASAGATADSPAGSSFEPDRRWWLKWFSIGTGALAGFALGIPVLGYLLSPVIRPQPDELTDLGAVDDYPENQTRLVKLENPLHRPWDGVSGKLTVYVRRLSGDQFQVFAVNCTHLGCAVTWFADSGLFMCPCHGGVYYADGAHASGPPPRGLYTYRHEVKRGRLMADVGRFPTLHSPA